MKKTKPFEGNYMKHFIKITDYLKTDIFKIFDLADKIQQEEYKNYLKLR
ncbi:MAG TPA: hypothetical protein PLF27_00645 [Sedimentibacter sp.]|nr:hypothetical protein [Sedimentibacter sp.]